MSGVSLSQTNDSPRCLSSIVFQSIVCMRQVCHSSNITCPCCPSFPTRGTNGGQVCDSFENGIRTFSYVIIVCILLRNAREQLITSFFKGGAHCPFLRKELAPNLTGDFFKVASGVRLTLRHHFVQLEIARLLEFMDL